jgi:uncharacterized membrane protein
LSETPVQQTPEPRPGAVAQIGPFAILALGALWMLRHFYELPERVPIHWNARFQADGFVPRTRALVLMPVIFGAVICLMLHALQAGLRRSAKAGPMRASTVKALLAGEYFAALLCCGVLAASATDGRLLKPVLVIAAAGVLALLVYSIAVMRGVPREPPRNPSAWRAGGIIYVDRDDPALFVPKQIGVGYTFNFGHPAALPLTLAILVAPLAVLVLLFLLR